MKVVVNYTKPDSGKGPTEIFGLDVAIRNFMKAFFQYSRQETFYFLPGGDDSIEELKELASSQHIDFGRCAWISVHAPRELLSDADVFFRPDPNLGDHWWRRLQVNGKGFNISSIVHTMSGERINDVLYNFQLAPSRPGDTLICPSIAIRDAVKALWDIQADYLEHRFGKRFECPVELPIIPLGIHTERFIRITTNQHRATQRAALGIAEDEVVILYVGRLSCVTKAHPLPLLQAAQIAASRTDKKVRLVLFGYFKPEIMEKEFHELAGDYCRAPNLKVEFVMNNDPRFPDGPWAMGDIFTSLVDNIQESFGLTPIEAMAAGLPAVVSDWDGYRDGVRHGVDGFLIPTIGVPSGFSHEVAEHYFNKRNYGDYLLRSNQSVAVDAEMTAAAFTVLIEDPLKRKAMGAAGRQRAIENYDWRVVIKAYEDMWEEKAAKRTGEAKNLAPANWRAIQPSFPDPSAMFECFPTRRLSPHDKLELLAVDDDVARASRHRMNIFGMDMLIDQSQLSNLLGLIKAHPLTSIANLQAAMSITDEKRFTRSVAWLLKMGLVRRHNP